MTAPPDQPDEPARAAAVGDAGAVFDDHWSRWADAHDVPTGTPLVWDEPRVTLVGADPEHLRYVAVLRFGLEHAGRRFEGLARGPLSSPTFRVWLLTTPPDARPHPWWRRRRSAPVPRHRASTRPV